MLVFLPDAYSSVNNLQSYNFISSCDFDCDATLKRKFKSVWLKTQQNLGKSIPIGRDHAVFNFTVVSSEVDILLISLNSLNVYDRFYAFFYVEFDRIFTEFPRFDLRVV